MIGSLKFGLKNSGSLVVMAASLMLASVAASAQPAGTETVVVTGIRGSLESAMDTKRNANQVLDSISAEDIGKFPDKDIGEALQRVTGVQINRSSGGEGSTVTVRGGDPSLTRVEINGVGALSVTPGAGDRAIDFRDLPVEFVQRIEVVKSPTADMTEGGLGGTVRVITRRPFDSTEPFIAGSAEGVNASLPQTTDGKFALIGSKLFFNNTLGILLSGEYAQAHEYDGQALTTGWLRQNVNNAAPASGAASFANGQGAPANPLGSDFNGDGVFDWYPQIPRYFNNRRTTLRKAFNSAVEYRPNDDFKFFWDVTFASGRENVHNQALQLNDQGGVFDYAHTTVGADNTVSHIEETSNGVNRATGANNIPGTLPLDLTYRDILGFLTREQLTTSVGASYNVTSELTIDGRLDFGRARVDNEETDSTAVLFGMSQQVPGARSAVDYSNGLHAPDITFPGLDVTKSTGINNLDALYQPVINTSTERTEAFNATYKPGWASWLELKAGGLRHDYKVIETSYTKHATLTCRGSVSSSTTVVVPTTCGTITGIIDTTATVNQDPFYSTGSLGFSDEVRHWLDLNQNTVVATEAAAGSNIYDLNTMNPNVGGDGTCFSAGTNCTWKNYLANWSVQEGTTDVYGMASFDFPDFYLPVSGNVGVRYISTHSGSTGYSQNTNPTTKVVTFQQTTITGGYHQALPSANLKVDILPDELIARFAYGKMMARPAPSQLALNRTLDIVGHTGKSGNPGLLPFLSTDYDAGLEWYFNKYSFVSVGYFNKEISRFIQTSTFTLPVDDGTGALVNYSIQTFGNNNAPVTINGIEINVQYAFDWLPEPLDGFGILANYTSQSDTGFNTKSLIDGASLSFPGLSRTAYNYSLYYEKYDFSLRASYVWRSRWLINAAGRGNLPEFNDSYGEVDLSASYSVTPEISVFTDVVNLTDEQLEQENAPARPIQFDTFGQRIYFGVRAKF